MSWSNWPRWLKGGIILSGIYSIISIFIVILYQLKVFRLFGIHIFDFMEVLNFPSFFIPPFAFLGWNFSQPEIFYITILPALLIYFLIGAFIGILIDRFKKGKFISILIVIIVLILIYVLGIFLTPYLWDKDLFRFWRLYGPVILFSLYGVIIFIRWLYRKYKAKKQLIQTK